MLQPFLLVVSCATIPGVNEQLVSDTKSRFYHSPGVKELLERLLLKQLPVHLLVRLLVNQLLERLLVDQLLE